MIRIAKNVYRCQTSIRNDTKAQATTKMIKHTPVMLDQSINSLNVKKDGCYIDATFGSGGHSLEILSQEDWRGWIAIFIG